ncbi:MAG: HAMP domain-containing sensor histidine kinase [Balneolaceae bacterium]
MKIRSKLAWTYIILLIIGIIAISTYSILTIRSFLLDEGIEQFERDALSKALAAGSFQENFAEKVQREAQLSGYEMAVYNNEGIRFLAFPDSAFVDEGHVLSPELLMELERRDGEPIIQNEEDSEKLIAYVDLGQSENSAQYLRISQDKAQYYAAAASIRHIIYAGMFFSIGAVVIVSFLFARYMAWPIQQLNEAALDIAQGNLDREIDLNRNDEFGTLASSLNKMAGTLRADNEKLITLNEKQSQFFADITHEVRNPLHTISGALEMMELKNLSPEKKTQYIHTAQKQIKRIARLFEDIKTLQRYDFDENFITRKKFNLKKLVEEAAGVFLPIAQGKGLELISETKASCMVFADPDKMEQVLDNLITNAIKYTSKGQVKVGLIKKEGFVEVYVEDTGTGIGEEHLERLFDRFYRTDKARSRDKGGTGLGLSVVKGILNAHQSEIKVESKVGKGSRFYFTLPLSS